MKKLTKITTACLAAAAMAAVSVGVAEAGPQKKGKYGGNSAYSSGHSHSGGMAVVYPVKQKKKRERCQSSCNDNVQLNGKRKHGKYQQAYKQFSIALQENYSRASARGPNAQANSTAEASSYAKTWVGGPAPWDKGRRGGGGGGGHGGGGGGGGHGGGGQSASNNNGGGGHGGGGSSGGSGSAAGASGSSSASASTGG